MSFENIYDQYHLFVRRVIFRMSGATDIDDLVQETFLKAWKAQGNFDGRSSEKTWIARIAINCAIDSLRKRKKQNIECVDFSEIKAQVDDQKDCELREVITKALLDLEEPFKSAFVLVVVEGFSTKEAALTLKVEEGTVRSRVSRARSVLRNFLEKKGVSCG